MKYDLSIIIPSRQEMFLSGTVEKLIEKIQGNTEIIAVLDGEWSNPPIQQHEKVNVIYVSKSIGQRAATNLGVKLSKAKFIMKLDAHCLMDEGFDIKMIEAFKETGDDVTMVPIMRNLWMFSWNCRDCNWKKYQGPTPEKCEKCGGTNLRKKMMWVGKHNPQSTSYCFDKEPHFQYFEDYKHREPYLTDKKEKQLTETMSLQGSCFMCTREKYWELKLSDEELGNWGNQGIEIACKTWLSGGKVMCNHKTWYAHMFRTQGGDFSFPWLNRGSETQRTKGKVRKQVWLGKLPKQKYPLSWLVKRFMPVPGWSEEDLNKIS